MSVAQGGMPWCKENAGVHGRCPYGVPIDVTATWHFHLDLGCLTDVHLGRERRYRRSPLLINSIGLSVFFPGC